MMFLGNFAVCKKATACFLTILGLSSLTCTRDKEAESAGHHPQAPTSAGSKEEVVTACLQGFVAALQTATSYRVSVETKSGHTRSPTNFISEAEYELAIERPEKAAIIVKRGGFGPTLKCDGKLLEFAYLPHRNRKIVTTAPTTIDELTTDAVLGAEHALLLKGSHFVFGYLITGDPKGIVTKYFPNPEYVCQEFINNQLCCHLRSDNDNEIIDAWFSIKTPVLLHRVTFIGKGKGRDLVQQQDYKDWRIDEHMHGTLFQVESELDMFGK